MRKLRCGEAKSVSFGARIGAVFIQSSRMPQTHPSPGKPGLVPTASHQPRPGRQWTRHTVKSCLCMSTGGLGGGEGRAECYSFASALSPPHPDPYTLRAEASFRAGD